MSQASESRARLEGAGHHARGRPHHFPSVSQDDRLRKLFGLAADAPVPRVNEETLGRYYDHLVAHLSLPFEALYCQNGGEMRQLIHYVRVAELLDPKQGRQRNLQGLCCKAQNLKEALALPLTELGVREDNPNCQLIDDYAYWFVNWR